MVVLSSFTVGGADYHCKGPAGNLYTKHDAKPQEETFIATVITGAFGGIATLGLLSVFTVMLLAVLFREGRSLSKKPKSAEKSKLLEDDDEVGEQQLPSDAPVVSEATQLVVCVLLEAVCFVMIFAFFMTWLFVSRDILFFPTFMSRKLPAHLPVPSCTAPPTWMIMNIASFAGIFGWFLMGVWVLCCFVLVTYWLNPQQQDKHKPKEKKQDPSVRDELLAQMTVAC